MAFVRIHCWPHAQRNIDKRINKVKCEANIFKLKSDIEELQLAHSRDKTITKMCHLKLVWKVVLMIGRHHKTKMINVIQLIMLIITFAMTVL